VRKALLILLALIAVAFIAFEFGLIQHEAGEDNLSRSLGTAQHIWGPICGGRSPDIVRTNLAAEGEGADTLGKATWAWTQVLGQPKRYTTCKIEVDDRKMSRKEYCAVIVHEWGHLKRESQKHSLDPNSIMYYRLRPQNIPESC
jgi:hypothetical protein